MMEAEAVVAQGTLKPPAHATSYPSARDRLPRRLDRTTVQILAGILLQASDGRLDLAATDMELSLRTSLDAQIESVGSVVVPGRLLLELARCSPRRRCDRAQARGSAVEIRSGSATYRLHTYNAEDFPRLPDADAADRHEVDRETLLETVARVSRSASRDESRPVLTGVLMRFEPRQARDGRDRFVPAVGQGDADRGLRARAGGDRPGACARELARIAQAGERIELGVYENQVVFSTGDALLTTRRIDGQFPNYKQLVPETFEHELSLPREELLDVVRRVAVMAQRNSPLRLRFADGELTVSAQTQDIGEAASRSRCRSPASRSRSGSTPSSCATESSPSAASSYA
jgi:DNA polymerase-3 subunit beta